LNISELENVDSAIKRHQNGLRCSHYATISNVEDKDQLKILKIRRLNHLYKIINYITTTTCFEPSRDLSSSTLLAMLVTYLHM